MQRVVAVARAASKVEGDTAAAFRGRPFVVRQANRADFGDRVVFVADVVRTVHQEADPRQEQLLLVLERGDTPANAYEARYHERTIALEEAIESIELVAAFRAGHSGTPSRLLRRESEVGALFILLQRSTDGAWVVRWRSATADC